MADKIIRASSLESLTKKEERELKKYTKEYVKFLDTARTNRQVVDYFENEFRNDKDVEVFVDDDRTSFALVKYGDLFLSEGLNVLGAHTDSPCLHIKPSPIKEGHLGIRLDTQYYGGICKWQWVDQQVKVIGNVVKEGKERKVEFDGVLIDVAPHISKKRTQKVSEAFKGEDLDVLLGYATKEAFLKEFGDERDFYRAELYVVPVTKTNVLQDLIVGYGHDDRVCVFAQAKALIAANPKHTSVVFGTDREEIGSTGLTGAQGNFFERVVDQLIVSGFNVGKETKLKEFNQAQVREILSKSIMLSADVNIAKSYLNVELVDEHSMRAGEGMGIVPYGGSGGKYNGNQASHFLMDNLMCLFDKGNVVYQICGSPSKVDCGGGGTIAKYFAQRGIKTVDVGVPVVAMHSKNEVIHKGDLYQTIKGFKTFLER